TPRDPVLQRLSVEQLHDHELLAIVLADVVDGADVRMIQRRGNPRFTVEPVERLRVRGELGRQKLDRDLPAEPHVFRAINDAHSAAAEALENAVVSDRGPDHDAPGLYGSTIAPCRIQSFSSRRCAKSCAISEFASCARRTTSTPP